MSVEASTAVVGTSPTLLASGGTRDYADVKWLEVTTDVGAKTIYLGGPDVTTSNGRPVTAGHTWSCSLGTGDDIYAVVGTGIQAVYVLESRVGA